MISGAVVMVFEVAGMSLFPLPADIDVNDPASLGANMARIPFPALASVVLGWLFGTSAGAAFAAWRTPGGARRSAVTVGVAMQAAGVADLMSFPHPHWMIAAAAVVFLPPSWLVGGLFEARGGQD